MLHNTKFQLAPTAFFFALTLGALALTNPAAASAQSISGERALLGVDRSVAAPAAFQNTAQGSTTVDPRYPSGEQALLGTTPQGDQAAVQSESKPRLAHKGPKIDGPRALLGRGTFNVRRPADAPVERREP